MHSWLLTSKVNKGSRVVVKLGATHLTITSLNDGSPGPTCGDVEDDLYLFSWTSRQYQNAVPNDTELLSKASDPSTRMLSEPQ